MTGLASRFLVIFESAWRRRYAIIVPALLLPVLGGIVGHMAPKKYAAHTSMLIQETAKMNPFLEDLAISAMLKERFPNEVKLPQWVIDKMEKAAAA